MSTGFNVSVDQLRSHAGNLDAVRERFEAVRAASTHIAQDDQAYGQLCGWIAGVLEGRHTRQDELMAFVEENLDLVTTALRGSADDYESVEDASTSLLGSIDGEGAS